MTSDFDDIKLLEMLNIRIVRITNSEILCHCPLHEDKNPSFGYNRDKKLFNCFVCGGGTLSELIEILGGNVKLKENNSLFNIDIEKKEEMQYDLPEVKIPFQIGVYPSWILDRGFTKKLAKKWEMCYNSLTGSLVIPIRDNQKRLVGWVCRRPQGFEPKYIYNVGLEKEKLLFGEHNLRLEQNFVCVCEGPLDAIWLDQYGFNAIALLGMQLSKTQQQRLINLRKGEYIICLDNDEAGRKGIYGYRDKRNIYHQGFISKMKKYGVLSIISLPQDKKDIQDIRNPQQVKNIIENRKLVY